MYLTGGDGIERRILWFPPLEQGQRVQAVPFDPAAKQAVALSEIRPLSIRRLPNIVPRHTDILHIRKCDRSHCPFAPQRDFPADSLFPGKSEVGRLAEACFPGTTVPRVNCQLRNSPRYSLNGRTIDEC